MGGIMVRSQLTSIVLLALLAAPASTQQTGGRHVTLDLFLDLESVSNPQFSPDGRQILYSRQWVDKLNDRRSSGLWLMNEDGSRNRFLLTGSSATWSPDGGRIAYVASGEQEGSQIHVRWMDDEGAVSRITRVTGSPSNLRWSPDGTSIAFTMFVPASERAEDRWRISLPGRPPGANWTPDPRIVERLVSTADGRGFLEEGFEHVFVVPATGGAARQVTSGDWDHSAPVWMPDGRSIVVTSNRVEGAELMWRESEIYSVDIATGATRELTRRVGPDGSPTVSPDGRYIAYTGYDVTDNVRVETRVYVMNADGSNSRVLTANFDRSPGGLMWAPDGAGIYTTVEEEGTENLYHISLSGEVRRVTQGNHMLSVSSITTSGRAVGTLTSYYKPNDIVSFDVARPAEIRQLTFVNDAMLAGHKLGEVEEIWYNSLDNFRVQGWIVKPPDFDASKKYPMILAIHGGPHSMYNVGFNFAWQEHAANGYVVLYTNPRGSTGYGEKFAAAISNAFPDKDYQDLMTGVDSLIGRGYVDERNLFVYGCSGGGVLTAWTVTQTNRFAAAAVACPVINWISFVGTVDDPRRASLMGNFAKWPWEDPSGYIERSPLFHVENVTTPTMLMTGVRDLRTPMSQTEEFYRALKLRGVPTAVVRMNDEWHGTTSRPSNFMRTQLYLRHWFERYRTANLVGSGR
jgi:dipeptidyl aminopeptidase/acylaminoacyl peptidase